MARWWTARSVKRQHETDHTRITLLEDDADTLEGRIFTLEEKEHHRQIEEGREDGLNVKNRLSALEQAEESREKREAIESAYGALIRIFGLAAVAAVATAVAEWVRTR